MFLLLIIIIIILLFIFNNNIEYFSGGTNIQLNSNDASPTQTTLTQYRPYWLKTFYNQEQPTYEQEYAQTVADDFNQNFDNDGNNFGIINERFECNKCNKKNNLYNIADYVVSNNYEQVRI